MSPRNNNKGQHYISEKTLDLAIKNGQISLKHGQKTEKLGKTLQKQEESKKEGELIEKYGKTIQEQAKDLIKNVQAAQQQQAQGEAATETYRAAVENHIKQTEEENHAIQEYSKIIAKRVKSLKTFLENQAQDLNKSKNK